MAASEWAAVKRNVLQGCALNLKASLTAELDSDAHVRLNLLKRNTDEVRDLTGDCRFCALPSRAGQAGIQINVSVARQAAFGAVNFRRLRSLRDVLAALNHPNIAAIEDRQHP